MTNEENKVIEAVKIIQQYCDREKHCSDCIFGEENHITERIQCGLCNRYPYDWDSLKEVNADE